MSFRRARRDAEATRDFLVRVAGGDELDHLTLPIGDHGRPLMQDCDHGGDANNGQQARLLTGWRNFGRKPRGLTQQG